MSEENLIYQWLGYLSNPVRMAQINAEIPSDEERKFRNEYYQLTGQPLTLDGKGAPFWVWKPGTNKRTMQLRLYFVGDKSFMPKKPKLFSITKGRIQDGRHWRINSGGFVKIMFESGFLLNSYMKGGVQAEYVEFIREKIPDDFKQDFDHGFGISSEQESLELRLREHCNQKGVRTFREDALNQLESGGLVKQQDVLSELRKRGAIKKSEKRGFYTLKNALFLRDEIEHRDMKSAISAETNKEKREYLVETYARNQGWKRLAKETFGTKCMCDNCCNSFIKDDNTPYIETHHIVPLHAGGEDGIWNLSVLCAHHHRMAHFARKRDRDELKAFLLKKNKEIINRND